jgi:hypothetical protein
LFPDWKELEDKAAMWPIRETYDPMMVRRPESWRAISCHDVPGKHR